MGLFVLRILKDLNLLHSTISEVCLCFGCTSFYLPVFFLRVVLNLALPLTITLTLSLTIAQTLTRTLQPIFDLSNGGKKSVPRSLFAWI